MEPFDFVVIFFAKYAVFIIVAFAVGYWLTLPKKQKIQMLVFGVFVATIAFLLTRIGGALYYDSRPFVSMGVDPIIPHADNNGFPSDHTALAFTAAATMFYMNKKLGILTLVVAILVGASRVLGYIHSPIDILGSIMFVAIAYAAAYRMTQPVMRKIYKNDNSVAQYQHPDKM